jgi:hypothetical protein
MGFAAWNRHLVPRGYSPQFAFRFRWEMTEQAPGPTLPKLIFFLGDFHT